VDILGDELRTFLKGKIFRKLVTIKLS